MIVVGIDDHPQPVGVQQIHVPPAQPLADLLTVVQANPDVDGLIVKKYAGLCALAYRLPLLGVHLGKAGYWDRAGPIGLIEPTVDLYLAGHPNRRDHGPGRPGRLRRLLGW
jgi:hypothetical protein